MTKDGRTITETAKKSISSLQSKLTNQKWVNRGIFSAHYHQPKIVPALSNFSGQPTSAHTKESLHQKPKIELPYAEHQRCAQIMERAISTTKVRNLRTIQNFFASPREDKPQATSVYQIYTQFSPTVMSPRPSAPAVKRLKLRKHSDTVNARPHVANKQLQSPIFKERRPTHAAPQRQLSPFSAADGSRSPPRSRQFLL